MQPAGSYDVLVVLCSGDLVVKFEQVNAECSEVVWDITNQILA